MSSDLGLPLRGAAIGNGWMDGRAQYPAYLDYGIKHGIIDENSDVRILPNTFFALNLLLV